MLEVNQTKTEVVLLTRRYRFPQFVTTKAKTYFSLMNKMVVMKIKRGSSDIKYSVRSLIESFRKRRQQKQLRKVTLYGLILYLHTNFRLRFDICL